MPRQPRNHFAGGLFHVGTRGVRKLPIFIDDFDRRCFTALLERAIGRSLWRCPIYCLMTNHYHLVVDMPEPSLSSGMHWLNGSYAQWFNRRHGVEGHVFEDRFYSEEIEGEAHLLEVSRYVPLNPVRAGICRHPSQWPWSSYRATIGTAPPGFLSCEWLLALFGREPKRARERYREFVEIGIEVGRSRHVRGTGPGTWLD
jgi:putative transposase